MCIPCITCLYSINRNSASLIPRSKQYSIGYLFDIQQIAISLTQRLSLTNSISITGARYAQRTPAPFSIQQLRLNLCNTLKDLLNDCMFYEQL